ncbi:MULTISPECIES: PAS domain S-box protein [unclassified Bradyrhizobium]|uniref:PAS domain S-box protein n=1 Tax=unclassified Bradyrhizobium TaxID=2631580 RepID=UPI0028E74EAE|nr:MULTISPECIES: PAS domain S-box protein [unclassified Bradyrhizobium]
MGPSEIASRRSFRRQIILTFVVGFFFLISAFSIYLVESERTQRHLNSINETTGLAQSLAANSVPWVLANDVEGLEEVVLSLQRYPEFRYAMVISPSGRVLAHSDLAKVGQFLSDEKSLALLEAPPENRVMRDDASVAEVAVPVSVGQRHVGWARIGLGREKNSGELRRLTLGSALFVLLATISALLAALLIANRLGHRIGLLVRVAEEVQAGNYATRANIPGGEDEITRLASSLNHMLDALARNEGSLRAAARYTRSLIEASLDPLVTINPDGKITDVNEATIRATGVAREVLVGSDFSNYFTEPDRARAGYREVYAKGFVTEYPLAIRHVSGAAIDVLYNASLYRDERGDVAGVFAAARDITERKRSEERNAQLAAIVESSDDAIFGKTLEGVITSWNKGAELIYGYTAQEVVGRSVSVLMPPGRRQEMSSNLALIREGRHIVHFETPRRRKDGKEIYVSLTMSPVKDDAGHIIGASAIERDVTELKQAGDALRQREADLRVASLYTRSLIEASLDPLMTIDPDGRITDVNEATILATGIAREALIGSDVSAYFTEPDKARAGYQEVYAKGFVTDYPLAIRHVSGNVTDVLFNASVYRDEKGNVAGVFAAARNVTALRRTERELRKEREHLEELVAMRTAELTTANGDLEATNGELEAFAYSVSHDLRVPLRAIDGFSRILLEDYSGKLDAEGQRVLNVVRDNAIKMARLIDDILAFSRAGRSEIAPARIDMDEAVRAVIEELAPAVAGRKLTFDIKPLAPAQGDAAMIRRVWTNLIDNAVKFTAPKPDAVIEIGSTAGKDETTYYVKDNGAGFDMQYATKLFGVFQRLHGSEFAGTGIGLAIVKRIVVRHGGRVWAEGKVNEGATFYFTLPVREDSHA